MSYNEGWCSSGDLRVNRSMECEDKLYLQLWMGQLDYREIFFGRGVCVWDFSGYIQYLLAFYSWNLFLLCVFQQILLLPSVSVNPLEKFQCLGGHLMRPTLSPKALWCLHSVQPSQTFVWGGMGISEEKPSQPISKSSCGWFLELPISLLAEGHEWPAQDEGKHSGAWVWGF